MKQGDLIKCIMGIYSVYETAQKDLHTYREFDPDNKYELITDKYLVMY